jgi:hypothetical protein
VEGDRGGHIGYAGRCTGYRQVLPAVDAAVGSVQPLGGEISGLLGCKPPAGVLGTQVRRQELLVAKVWNRCCGDLARRGGVLGGGEVGAASAVEIGSVRPVDGLTIFAVFFVAALAIERLLEPLSNALLPKAQLAKNAHEAMKQARSKTVEYLDRAAEQFTAGEGNPVLKVEVPPSDLATQEPTGVTTPEQKDDGDDRPPVTAASTAPSKSEADPAEANAAIQDVAAAVEALNVRQLQRAVNQLAGGGDYWLHRYELPDDHPAAPPGGGYPSDLLVLTEDNVLVHAAQ